VRTATPRPPGLVLAVSHVLDDTVASENRGGRRKFGETEDIALVREIVANDAHVCRRGNVTEIFEKVAHALNEGARFLELDRQGLQRLVQDSPCEFSNGGPSARISEWNRWRNLGKEISSSRISSPQSKTTKSAAGQSARNLLSATGV
jgi:hypothetical protein